jgi:predicted nucleic acid-binding protein
MRILLDTNIILDIALKRKPHYSNSSKLFQLIDNTDLKAFLTANSITDIYYIIKKEKENNIALEFIDNLIQIVDILDLNKEIIIKALQSGFQDFEDAIQSETSNLNKIDFIITRNIKDFSKSKVKAITPKQLLEYIK